ncbi:MAG: hypothetical protein LUG98_12815, partial [Tannerellaceae bacterium]|nr:hypothetical protein [Tannerellaceae bacterium]
LFLFALISILGACEEGGDLKKSDFDPAYDSSKLPIITMGDYSTYLGETITVSFTINGNGSTIQQKGIIASTDKELLDLVQAAYRSYSEDESENTTITLGGLQGGTTYYVAPYAVNAQGYTYGEVLTITTDSYERKPLLKEDFTTLSFQETLSTLTLGTSITNRGWVPTYATNFYSGTNPFGNGDAEYVIASETYGVFGSEGDIVDADNTLFFEADLTTGLIPQVTIQAFCYGAPPINNANYYDSYELRVSTTPFESLTEINNSILLALVNLDENNIGEKLIFSLEDFIGQKVYIGIRHTYDPNGYMLIISYLECSALYEN